MFDKKRLVIVGRLAEIDLLSDPITASYSEHWYFKLLGTKYYYRFNFKNGSTSWVSKHEDSTYPVSVYHSLEEIIDSVPHALQTQLLFHLDVLVETQSKPTQQEQRYIENWKSIQSKLKSIRSEIKDFVDLKQEQKKKFSLPKQTKKMKLSPVERSKMLQRCEAWGHHIRKISYCPNPECPSK